MELNENEIFEMKNRFLTYDRIVNATMINIYTLSKASGRIQLEHFEINEGNLGFLEIALIASNLLHMDVYLEMGIFEFIKFKYFTFKKYRNFKNLKRARKTWKGLWIADIMEYVADANEEPITVYGEIYNTYYSGKED